MLRPSAVKRIGQGIDDVARNHANRAALVARDVAGKTVHVNAKLCGVESRHPLPDQCRDDPGQHVSASPRGHSRITGLVNINTLPVGHHGTSPFEHHDELFPARREPGGVADAISLHRRNIGPSQTGKLAGVRCYHYCPGQAGKQPGLPCQRIEAVGINDQWFIRRFDEPANQTANVAGLAQARADGDDVSRSDQALERGDRWL